MLPRARVTGLDITETADGLRIHDTDRQQAHTLHPLAALVWKNADGRTSVSALAAMAREQLGADVTDELVWAAVDGLTQANLLEERLAPPSGAQRIGRRDLIRRVAAGSVAAAAFGAVAATPASAQGIDPSGQESAEKSGRESAAKGAREEASKEHAGKSGQEQDAKSNPGGHPLDLGPDGWTNVGAEFQTAVFTRQGQLVVLEGLITTDLDPIPLMRVATLPDECRPAGQLVFHVPSLGAKSKKSPGGEVSRIDILPDGQILLVDGDAQQLSLSGIVFAASRLAPTVHGDGEEQKKASQEQKHKKAAAEQDKKAAAEQRNKKQQEQQSKAAAEERQKAEAKAAEQKSKASAAEEQQKASARAAEQKSKASAAEEQQKASARAAEQKKKVAG